MAKKAWSQAVVGGMLILSLLSPFASPLGSATAESRPAKAPKEAYDYENPKLLSSTIYALGSQTLKVLFTFRRTATRSGDVVDALRTYYSSEGALAAVERVKYEKGQLASYQLEDQQSGVRGKAVIGPDPKEPGQRRIFFEYAKGPDLKKKTGSERLEPDTLINDMLPPFMLAHWGQLMQGATVKFRCIVLARTETVGFKLVKESETAWHGKPVVQLRMQPTSLLIAQFVKPIALTVERDAPHHILECVGRTTPQVRAGNGWKDLDALTVFDWAHSR